MDCETWQRSEEQWGRIAEKLDTLLESPEFQEIRGMLGELSKNLGDRYVVNLTCALDVFDHERARSLQLLNTGVSTKENGEVYRTWNCSTHQRYLVDGAVFVVPHDHCPKCWGEWDLKLVHRSCGHCDAEIGKNCKLLLDSEVCPYCEEGEVSSNTTQCGKCGFEFDPAVVAWA